MDDSQTDWDEKIDTVLMGYRASRHASTKHSPYFLMFHQQMRLPIENKVLPSSFEKQSSDDEAGEEDFNQKIQTLLSGFMG